MIKRGKSDDFLFGEADKRMPPGIEVVQRYRSGPEFVPDHYSNVEPKLVPAGFEWIPVSRPNQW